IGRTVDGELWPVPTIIRIEGDRIYWTWGDEPSKEIGPTKRMLESFYCLADASDKQILAFAKEYGIIFVCEHNLPLGHTTNPTGSCSPCCRWDDGDERSEPNLDVTGESICPKGSIIIDEMKLPPALREKVRFHFGHRNG